jgi:flagellar biosynthesis/type III secretory pathway chaperone
VYLLASRRSNNKMARLEHRDANWANEREIYRISKSGLSEIMHALDIISHSCQQINQFPKSVMYNLFMSINSSILYRRKK